MTTLRPWRRRLERSLSIVGVLCLGIFAFVSLEARAVDLYHGWRLDRALAESATPPVPEETVATHTPPADGTPPHSRDLEVTVTPVVAAAPVATAPAATLPAEDPEPRIAGDLAPHRASPETPTAADAADLVGRLRVPRLGMSSIVLGGIDSRTLRRAVGHVPGTAHPGERGNIALAGHRDTFFRDLRHVREDDTITLETPSGTLTYRVETLTVVPPEEVSVLADHGDDRLTLITCYPFHFIGRAPLRFIVTARPTAGSAEA